MKVTFILPGYPWRPVGGFRVVYEYANHLVARGHKVTVVHPLYLPNWNPSPPPDLYRWLRRKDLYRWLRRKADQIRNLIFKPKVHWQPIDPRVRMLYVPEPTHGYIPDADAVFATFWATAELLVRDYPPSKGEKIYLIQGYEIWGGPKERVEATYRTPLKKVVIAKWLYEKVLELGALQDEMVHIPNGINYEIFRLERPIENRPKRVTMMFSPVEWKGERNGVRALNLAKKEIPELQAVLFGTVRPPKWLPPWIEYRLNPRQSVLVSKIYNGSAIYLCPSWTEGWHLPPAEAMACGCAIVSTDIGGVRDYAEHGKTALLSPAKNPQELAKNLLRILKDDNFRIQLAKAGHERIKEFTWERSTDLLEQFLRKYVKI